MNSVKYLLFYMELLNYLFCDMFGCILECCKIVSPWCHILRRYRFARDLYLDRKVRDDIMDII